VRAFTAEEIAAIAAELSVRYQPLPAFAAANGLRPEEWQGPEGHDVDRRAGILVVRRTVSSGEVVELTKTTRSRREVPLTAAARGALDALPPRLDTGLLFPAPGGGLINLDNFRRREWGPAVAAAAIPTPARIYDLRSTFASRALAAGAPVFELARVMGTSIEMIERHYGTLLDGSAAGFAERLDAFEDRVHEVNEGARPDPRPRTGEDEHHLDLHLDATLSASHPQTVHPHPGR
jgi:integrase